MIEPPSPPTFRFAPSPNGFLHLGHAYSALLNATMARESRGRFLLRIEDIDIGRCRPDYERAIYEDLAWLGLAWETPVHRQSEHFADYGRALDRLRGRGLVYPCFCTRGDVFRALEGRSEWPRDPDGSPLYPGTCRRLDAADRAARLAAGDRAAWRLDLSAALAQAQIAPELAAEAALWGDLVVARRDVPTSYHLSVVIDDALQAITDVVRGRDLLASTSVHRLLQILLDLPAPRYNHHDLIHDGAGQKLSKSRGSPSLRDLRASGMTQADIRRAIGL